jgi:hypothetical protein
MIQSLLKLKFEYLCLVSGLIFVFLSLFRINDVSKVDIVALSQINWASCCVGIALILFGILLYVLPRFSVPLSWSAFTKVKATKQGLSIKMNRAELEVVFGRLENFNSSDPNTVIALPANDLFDDACVSDATSSLGSFVNHMFPNRIHEIIALTKRQLMSQDPTMISDAVGPDQRYMPGTTLFFDKPLAKDTRMAFVAVTAFRDNQGITCEASNVFRAIKGLHKLINAHRYDKIILPLLGSGHGGLLPPVSLICMLIALAESLRDTSGHHIRKATIVVFQATESSMPSITPWRVRRLLAFTLQNCQTSEL